METIQIPTRRRVLQGAAAGAATRFPHKIRGASAGWTRAVAIFEE